MQARHHRVFSAAAGLGLLLLAAVPPAMAQTPAGGRGPALVAADGARIAALRAEMPAGSAWRFDFALRQEGAAGDSDDRVTIVVSEADYAVISGPRAVRLVDYALGRVFLLDSETKTFVGTSLAAAPYFRVYEWVHRKNMGAMMEKLGVEAPPASTASDFWRSHALAIRPPNQPGGDITIAREGDALSVTHEGKEAIAMTVLADTPPAAMAERFWDALPRLLPLHPDFISQVRAEHLLPARLSIARTAPDDGGSLELTLLSHARIDHSYPLTADFAAAPPRRATSPQMAEVIAVAWDAARGNFSPGQPDTAYWRDLFVRARESGSWLQQFLAFYALGLYVGSQESPGCDGTAGLDPAVLCPLVKQASDRDNFGPELMDFLRLVSATDPAGRQAAIAGLPDYREQAGELAPIIDVFIANQIGDLTNVVTRGGKGLPDRDDAVPHFLSALKAFPFIRQIYGDIAIYYFRYFDMELGFYFADVGRALPVGSTVLPRSNLNSIGRIEESLSRDFPIYF